MKHCLKIASICALAAFLAEAPAVAQETRLRSVGEITYEPRPAEPQTGLFRLRREDQFIRAMRIQSDSGGVTIRDLRLIYRDGDTQRVRVDQRIRAGESTSLIRLQEPRPIRDIEITYVPEGRVTLVLRTDARPPEPPPPPRPTWVEVGCMTAGFLLDRDTTDIKGENRFDALRLRASTFDMEVSELSVRYSNGTREVYPLRSIIPNGAFTGAIDLRSRGRRVTQVEIIHRSRVISNQKGQTCIEGLRAREEPEQ